MIDLKRLPIAGLCMTALTGAVIWVGGCGGDRSCPCAREDLTCTGGSGPGGGTGGTSGGGGPTGGTAGGSPEAGPGPELCETSGCAVLTVPLAAANDRTDFIIEFGESGLLDMSASVITFRIYVLAGSGGGVQPYVRNGSGAEYATVYQWHALAGYTGWSDVTIDVSSVSLDKTQIEAIGLQLAAGSSGPWTTPTVVYVDSITVSDGVTGPYEFATSSDPLVINTFNTVLDGSTVSWIGPAAGSAGAGGAGGAG